MVEWEEVVEWEVVRAEEVEAPDEVRAPERADPEAETVDFDPAETAATADCWAAVKVPVMSSRLDDGECQHELG